MRDAEATGPARCPEAEEVVLAEATASFPVAACTVAWSDRSGDRAVVLIDVVQDGTAYLHQVCCVREGGTWCSWTEGKAPGWLEVDDPFGVVTSVDILEAGTTAVKLTNSGEDRPVAVSGGRLFQALWDVSAEDGEWRWPEPVSVCVNGRWERPALPGVPVRTRFLIDVYLRFERDHAPQDSWAWSVLDGAVSTHPSEAWAIVREAIRRAPDDQTLFTIAAGPLEELVAQNLNVVIDEIETDAARDPKLSRALSGVWASVADEALARRLTAVGYLGPVRDSESGHDR